jgi:hypothetical protein
MIAPGFPKVPRRRGRRAVETLLLLASCATLLWMSRQPRGPEPLPGALHDPWASTAVALLAACAAPGYVLARLLRAGRDPLSTAGYAMGLGLSWLLPPCAAALGLRASIHQATAWSTAGTLVLVAAYALRPLRTDSARRARLPGAAALALLAAAPLVAASLAHRGFTFSSDEWYLLRATRYLLDAPAIARTSAGIVSTFDVWNVVTALLVKLAGVDLVEGWRTLLPAVLLPAALLAYIALARALVRSWSFAALAVALLAVLALSDMHTRGEGMGMALLVRLLEDKYAALHLLVPLAQASALDFLRTRRARPLLASALLGVAATAVHPMAAVWLGLSLGGCLLVSLASGRLRLDRRALLASAAAAIALLAVALALRAQRPARLFVLYTPQWSFNQRLLDLTKGQLIVLSREDGWLMAHPALLRHPLTLAGVAAATWALTRRRRSLAARFLGGAVWLPLLIVYNPLTASALARAISPWMMHRVTWGLPVSLALAYALHAQLGALALRARHRASWLAAAAAPALVVLIALLSVPGMRRAFTALQKRNFVYVSPGEKELFLAMAADPRLAGTVIAPPALSIHLGAWSSRFHALPGQDAFRDRIADLLDPCARLRSRRRLQREDFQFLRGINVSYVVARDGSRLDRALESEGPAFLPRYRGSEYVLYAFRRDRWDPSPPR